MPTYKTYQLTTQQTQTLQTIHTIIHNHITQHTNHEIRNLPPHYHTTATSAGVITLHNKTQNIVTTTPHTTIHTFDNGILIQTQNQKPQQIPLEDPQLFQKLTKICQQSKPTKTTT